MTDQTIELDSGPVVVRGFGDGLVSAGDEVEIVYVADEGWLGISPDPDDFAQDVAEKLADGRLVFEFRAPDPGYNSPNGSTLQQGQELIGDVLEVHGAERDDGTIEARARVRMVLADDRPPERREELQAGVAIWYFVGACAALAALAVLAKPSLVEVRKTFEATRDALNPSSALGFGLSDALVIGALALLVSNLAKFKK